MDMKASKSRNDSMLNPHNIRRTRFKLLEYKREQRLKNRSVYSGPTNSTIESVPFPENKILEPLYSSKLNYNGVRPFPRHRRVPVKPISNDANKSFIIPRKQREFLNHPTTSKKQVPTHSKNHLASRLSNNIKNSNCDVHYLSRKLDGQVDSFKEHKKPSSTFCANSSNVYDASLFESHRINRYSDNYNYGQTEKLPSYSLTGTSKHPSNDFQKLVSGFIRNHPTSVNICKSLASSSTSPKAKSYSQSVNLQEFHNRPKNHSVLVEEGYCGTISKNTNTSSAVAYPSHRVNRHKTSAQETNFNQPISRNTAPNRNLNCPSSYKGASKNSNQVSTTSQPLSMLCPTKIASRRINSSSPCSTVVEVGSGYNSPDSIPSKPSTTNAPSLPISCPHSIFKSKNRVSTTSQPLSILCPTKIASRRINSSSPCSTVVEVGSGHNTPDSIPSPPSTTNSPSLPISYPYSSKPISDVLFNSQAYQPSYITDESVYINQIYGHSYRPSKKFVYPKLVLEANGQNNISPKEDGSLKSPALCTSENISNLPYAAESFLLPKISPLSEPIPQAPCNSSASKFTSKSLYCPNANERLHQICCQCFNCHRISLKQSSIYPQSVSEENVISHNSSNVNYSLKPSLVRVEKGLHFSRIQRVPVSKTLPTTCSCTSSPSGNIQNNIRSVNQPYFNYAVLYSHPKTRSSNNTKKANLYSGSNYENDFLTAAGTSNLQMNAEESCRNENIFRSVSQYFDSLRNTDSNESTEVSLSSNEPNSEYSGNVDQCKCKTKILKLISCFSTCFGLFSHQQEPTV